MAAMPPASANARSLVRLVATVYAAAVSGLSRTPIVVRPMPEARNRATTTTTTASRHSTR